MTMQPFIRGLAALCLAGTTILSVGYAQKKPKKLFPQRPLALGSFNKSLSPRYLQTTSKFIRTGAVKTTAGVNTGATPKSTVTLNRGGTEGRAPSQTTESGEVQNGAYTCETRNVNERSDYFRQPLFSQGEVFYPGALFNATSIINNQVGYYSLPNSYQRQPYRISANLFTMTGTPQNPTEVIGDNEDYSLASYRAAKSLIVNRNAAANPPVEAFVEYIEANTKEEVALQLGYNVSATIPAELVMLLAGVPVGGNVDASVSTIANSINEKSRLILKVNYNFYSVDASPTNDEVRNFTAPFPGSDIAANVVYVSSVLYGTTGYVYFESDKSFDELKAAVEEAIAVAGPVDVGNISVNVSAEARRNFTSAVSKMVAYGKGLGINPGSSMPIGNLDNLLSLIGNLRSWGPNNQGSPIAYTMNFLNDGVQAIVSYGAQFVNKVCTQTPVTDLKFDVDLELERFTVANVRDLDGTEDLYGRMEFTNLRALGKNQTTNFTFWSKEEENANENNFRNGQTSIDKRTNLIKNLSFDELRNIELTLGGKLMDDESILPSRSFRCVECSDFNGDYSSRTVKFIETPSVQNTINSLQNNGEFQLLKFGDDNFIITNYYESNNKNDGWVKVLYRVWVKPHL